MVAGVFFVLSGAYISSTIVQSQAVKRQSGVLQSFFSAEKGIEYAFVESQNHNWNWATHQVDSIDLDGDTKINDLSAKAVVPTVTLQGASINPVSFCYEIDTPQGKVEVKAYADPDKPGETIVLSRNVVDSNLSIIRFRITRKSLYKYFFYYPGNKWFGWMTFDGQGLGGIYVNGDIVLGGMNFTNVTEISTNSNGTISLWRDQYTPAYYLDDMDGVRNGKAPLPSLSAGHIYSATNPYPWQDWKWPPSYWVPYDWKSVGAHFSSPGKINEVNLPMTLQTTWNWDKYWGPDKGANPGGVSEQAIQFYDLNDNLADSAYWSSLEATYGAGYFDPDFWDTKTYQRNSETVSVNYLSTGEQASDWNAWLDSAGSALKGIVKEKSSGGYDTVAPNIEANYSELAKANGLYIGKNAGGDLEIWLNGAQVSSLPIWMRDNVEFFNTVRTKDRNGDGNIDKENVLELDISQTLGSTETPNNDIIYIAHKNIRVVNSKQLPKNLTIVSPYNVYIKGDFNYDPDKTQIENEANWKSAAVITNSLVYFLSGSFNDPQTLPATIYPREYPYELQYVNLTNFVPGDPAKLTALESECERFFGLNTGFDISSAGNQPANLDNLKEKIRTQYNNDYKFNMPNKAQNTTVYLAVASPYDISHPSWDPGQYNQLERWYKESWSSDTNFSAALTVKGAFIQLKYSWVNDCSSEPCVPVRDVPAVYWKNRAGGENDAQVNPSVMQHKEGSSLMLRRYPNLVYEKNFSSPEGRPSGDFFAGSHSRWERVSDFNHHF